MRLRHIQKALVKEGDKFLVLLRAKDAKHFPCCWDFPGGKLEEGEDPFAGIEREVLEETGLKVKALQIVGTYHVTLEDKIPRRFIIYSANTLSGNLKISSEHSDFKWATREEILRLETEPYIKMYLENKK